MHSDTPLIELREVRHSYREGERDRQVLRGISLTIRRGEILALLGRSGSGKSTLLNLIGGIDLPGAGDIIIDGQVLNHMDERHRTLFRRRRLGFVYQLFNLIPTLTVLESREPPNSCCSSARMTRAPERPAASAAMSPAGPAPTTRTSQ